MRFSQQCGVADGVGLLVCYADGVGLLVCYADGVGLLVCYADGVGLLVCYAASYHPRRPEYSTSGVNSEFFPPVDSKAFQLRKLRGMK